MTPEISLTLDHAQTRVIEDRNVLLAAGSYPGASGGRVRGWDRVALSNVWVDPITFTAMLMPAPEDPTWDTSGAGIYARLRKTDYTLTTPSNWDESTSTNAADYWLFNKDVSEPVITAATWPKNRPFFLAWFAFNSGNERKTLQMECGWNATATVLGGVSVRFYKGGEAEVLKNGEVVGSYTISGSEGAQNTAGGFVAAYLIPFRRRELLVVTSLGSGFTHVFEDVDESDPDPTITAATHFWWNVIGKSHVQCAPLRFASAGYICSPESAFATPPKPTSLAGTPFTDWDPAFYGTQSASASLVEVDSVGTPFIVDGVTARARIRVDLTGDNNSTPFLASASAGFVVRTGLTDDSEATDLLPYATKLSLDVPETMGGAELRFTLLGWQNIPGVHSLEAMSERPVQLKIGDVVVFDGRILDPTETPQISEESGALDLTAHGLWHAMENYIFMDPVPLHGVNLATAFEFIIAQPGIGHSIEPIAYDLSRPSGQAAGEFGILVEAGDKASEKLKALFEDFAATDYLDETPQPGGASPVIVFKSTDTLDAEPTEITLYPSIQEAIDAGHTDEPWKWVYREFRQQTLRAECNDLRVTGWNGRLGRPIQVFFRDEASQDATLPPSMRGENWVGEPLRTGIYSQLLTSDAALDRAISRLIPRLTKVRKLAEWHCFLPIRADGTPLWKATKINLQGRGNYKVTSLGVDFAKVTDVAAGDDWAWHSATFTGERRGPEEL